jgi:hypothetical protein
VKVLPELCQQHNTGAADAAIEEASANPANRDCAYVPGLPKAHDRDVGAVDEVAPESGRSGRCQPRLPARCVRCTMQMAGRYSNGRAASSKMSRCEVFWE